MKKYALLMLVLALAVGCLLAFSSCGEEPAPEPVGECEHAWDDGVVTKAATCTVDGTKLFTCTKCAETKTEAVPAAHTWNTDFTVDTPATCAAKGSKSIHCSKCSATKDVTEIPMAEHVWDTDFTEDTPATCSAKGSKSIHCANCSATKDVTEIPALDGHTVENWTVTTAATLFTDGSRSGECSVCHETITETIPAGQDVHAFNAKTSSAPSGWGSGSNLFPDRIEIATLTADYGSFYPTAENPDGQDLFLEFSFLWNETVNYGSENKIITIGRFDKGGSTPTAGSCWFTLGVDGTDCPINGAFELGRIKEVITGHTSPVNGTADDYTLIGGYGWHRIGVRWHEDAEIKDGAVVYTLTYSLYLDGVLCDQFTLNDDYVNNQYMLFEAAIDSADPSKLVYSDVNYDPKSTKKTLSPFRVDNFFGASADRWLVIADYSVTGGTDFVQQVQKVSNPAAADFAVNDTVTLPGAAYYKLAEKPAQPTETFVFDGTQSSTPSGWGSGANLFPDRIEIATLTANYGPFYPTAENPNGKDLFLEFSFLWNETVNYGSQNKIITIGRFDAGGSSPTAGSCWFTLGVDGTDCPINGAFELGRIKEVITGHTSPVNGTADDYTLIGGYGWHRIGVRWHEDAEIKDGAVVYTLTYSLYLDGVLCDQFTLNDDYVNNKYMLFEATIDPSDPTKLVYSDVQYEGKKTLSPFRVDGFFGASQDRWFVIGDYSVTGGTDFVLDVEKVDAPVADTFTVAEGVKISAPMYYTVK